MRYIPVPGVVVIEPIQDDSVIQSVNRNYTNAGKVVEVPSDWYFGGYGQQIVKKTPLGIKKGDIIFYDEYAYRRFDFKGEEITCVDTRGDGVWLIAKQNDTETGNLQTEGIPS